MKYFLMAAFFTIGLGVGILITPEPPTGYEGFVSVEACQLEIDKIFNTAMESVTIAKECIATLEVCTDSLETLAAVADGTACQLPQ